MNEENDRIECEWNCKYSELNGNVLQRVYVSNYSKHLKITEQF